MKPFVFKQGRFWRISTYEQGLSPQLFFTWRQAYEKALKYT